MPTYAYACTACEHAFDFIQSFSDDPLTVCPACDGRLRKIYGSIGVTFKGSGFYRNDARKAASDAKTRSSTGPDGVSGRGALAASGKSGPGGSVPKATTSASPTGSSSGSGSSGTSGSTSSSSSTAASSTSS